MTELRHIEKGALQGRHIVLAAGGSIAAYKLPHLVSVLRKAGAEVSCLLSAGARHFVTEEALRTMSQRPVYSDSFDPAPADYIPHIRLAEWADLILVAPASANLIARLALGMADDIIGQTVLAARCPCAIAPAMNVHMLEHVATQENLARLKGRGWELIEAAEGLLACGYEARGRLPEPEELLAWVLDFFQRQDAGQTSKAGGGSESVEEPQLLAGLRVLVSAGPTREALDPVRFLTNHSSGKMGYALARMARLFGAQVQLVSGPTALQAPEGVDFCPVETAAQMLEALEARFDAADVLIMAAAVADYRPVKQAAEKMKKQALQDAGELVLQLEPTTDILATLSARRREQLLCGFCMETEELLPRAEEKRRRKGLDLICANSLREQGAGFGVDSNHVTILDAEGQHDLGLCSKEETARRILAHIAALRGRR